MAAGLRLGAGKGLEFNVAAEAAARAQDPRESRLGRWRTACPGPKIYCPGAKGGPTGPVVDYTQCASSYGSGARRPHGPPPHGRSPSSSVFLSRGSQKRDTGGRLGPACLSPYLQLISESLGPGMRPGAEAAGNETPDADLAPARICFGPTQRRGARTLNRGNGDQAASQSPHSAEPPGPLTGPAGQASGQHGRGPDRIAAHGEAEHGPGQRRPGGQLDVSAWQACDSRRPPP